MKKFLRTRYFLPIHAENRGKIQRLKKEQKRETKQLTHTLGDANRLKKEGHADGGKATEEKLTVEKRQWKNERENYGEKATVEMHRKAFKKRKNKCVGKPLQKMIYFFGEEKLEN